MNRNVALNLVLAVTSGLADNMWGGTVLVAYLYQISGGSNTRVGLTTAVQGLTSMATALPAGYFADKYSRAAVIRVGAVVQLLFMAGMFVAVFYGGGGGRLSLDAQFYVICASLGMSGFAGGIISGPAQALLADSLETGFREKYYNYLFVLYLFSSCVGPLVCIALFQTEGDDWSLSELRTLLAAGVSLELLSVVGMCMFRDDAALGEESEAITERAAGGQPPSELEEPSREAVGDGGAPSDSNSVQSDSNSNEDSAPGSETPSNEQLRRIPYIVFGTDLMLSLASGCTIKFFPLFFKNDCGLSPSAVQAIYVVVPLAMACCSTLATKLSARVGSVQAVLCLRVAGLGFFGVLIALYHYGYASGNAKWAIVAVYVARTAAMNSVYPIEESILMDYVPKKQRARWKSLESVSAFGWCGSAFLGGWLADQYSYTFTFMITISMQALATLIYASLLPLVK